MHLTFWTFLLAEFVSGIELVSPNKQTQTDMHGAVLCLHAMLCQLHHCWTKHIIVMNLSPFLNI